MAVDEIGGDEEDQPDAEEIERPPARPVHAPQDQCRHAEDEHEIADRIGERERELQVVLGPRDGRRAEEHVPHDAAHAEHDDPRVGREPYEVAPRPHGMRQLQDPGEQQRIEGEIAGVGPGGVRLGVEHHLVDELDDVAEQIGEESPPEQPPRPTHLACEALVACDPPAQNRAGEVDRPERAIADGGLVGLAAPAEDLPGAVEDERADHRRDEFRTPVRAPTTKPVAMLSDQVVQHPTASCARPRAIPHSWCTNDRSGAELEGSVKSGIPGRDRAAAPGTDRRRRRQRAERGPRAPLPRSGRARGEEHLRSIASTSGWG